jgi:hypothetical protein
MTVGTAALRMPRSPNRYAMQWNLLAGRRVAEVVREAPGGRLDPLLVALELRGHYGCSIGAGLAAVRRALIRGDVVLIGDELELPDAAGGAAA